MQKMSFSSDPKTKVNGLRPPGTARAQPCKVINLGGNPNRNLSLTAACSSQGHRIFEQLRLFKR